jgi:hypothetical protein
MPSSDFSRAPRWHGCFWGGIFVVTKSLLAELGMFDWKNETELKITRSLNRSRNSKNFRALVDPRKSFGFLLSWKESKTVPKQKHCARSIGQFKDHAAQLDNKNTALAKSHIIMYFTDASTLCPWFVFFDYYIFWKKKVILAQNHNATI